MEDFKCVGGPTKLFMLGLTGVGIAFVCLPDPASQKNFFGMLENVRKGSFLPEAEVCCAFFCEEWSCTDHKSVLAHKCDL